jgi:hypothetical protein
LNLPHISETKNHQKRNTDEVKSFAFMNRIGVVIVMYFIMRSEVLPAGLLKIQVFWVATQYQVVHTDILKDCCAFIFRVKQSRSPNWTA